MYRIRFHGRGGQGMKTASRILGSAFFQQGYEVQDAPRYGAERRGAPVFAYVRAARRTIQERGIILEPDLVIVADDSLVPMPAAGVLQGVTPRTVLLISSGETPETWRHRLNIAGPLLTLQAEAAAGAEQHFVGTALAGAAARLVGVITLLALEQAVQLELAGLGGETLSSNLDQALAAYELMAPQAGLVSEGEALAAAAYQRPDWVELPLDEADAAAAAIHAGATSVEVRTGLWRTLRPVIDYQRCNRCWWVCSEFCPDSAIRVNAEHFPEIDYDHCKGCLICVAQCPAHAISAIPESSEAQP
ncbi:pyruvate ferredoxin oxidoreductase, gamma subunit [Sulfuricella sp. T08]|uniref:2-oxoacid:acceptor oxidoreductase family protein n=1 Tax=Sulfuricella sp. T08 TaxID=1632857 RepID=UPI000617A009|nr:2-oxoacid:acceptor oxidoreductase family protein [Sulfuricella sp. T08]GAO35111.1 pyruvate ferredoxin oxidoreductase, gamma subunit [Sulfuricella sp. T08]